MLLQYNIITETLGGDVQCVPISALKVNNMLLQYNIITESLGGDVQCVKGKQ